MKTNIKINFKQKNLIIKKIGMDYKKNNFDGDYYSVNEESHSYLCDKEYYKNIKDKVDYILLQMDKKLSMLIYNDFFSTKIDNWWIYYFSRSTYYRIKNQAMDNFLEWWYA